MDAESQPSKSSKRKRRLPAGMSDYQAAWIADEDLEGLQESDEEEQADTQSQGGKTMQPRDGQSVFLPDLEDDEETDDMQASLVVDVKLALQEVCKRYHH